MESTNSKSTDNTLIKRGNSHSDIITKSQEAKSTTSINMNKITKIKEKRDRGLQIEKASRGGIMYIYVGDSTNVINRILTNHCSGNVEGSAFRSHVAEEMGYKLKKTRRPSGSTRVRIDLPNPKVGENAVTAYIRSGNWRYVICNTYDEAHDFQWYVIEQLNPLLNRDRESWNRSKTQRYESLLRTLLNSPALTCEQLKRKPSGPGVYLFCHDVTPHDFKHKK